MSKTPKTYITKMEELRRIEMEALEALVAFCEEHNLMYYMTGGTLLGAVRHKGFIPWDDDIDIVMPRPDYEKLMSLSNGRLGKHHRIDFYKKNGNHCRLYYRVVDNRTGYQDEYFSKRYVSSMGIDVFPIDGVPSDPEEREVFFKKILHLRKLFMLSVSAPFKGTSKSKAFVKTLCMIPAKIMGSSYYYKKINDLVSKYPYEECDQVALVVGYYNKKEVLEKTQYGKGIFLEFEGNHYRAPYDYKTYLTNLYGDYLKLPPESQRTPHHTFKVWRK